MKKKNEFDLLLAREFVKVFKRKFADQFGNQMRHTRKIPYGEFRKFCGRSFGFNKHEANEMLDTLMSCGLIELSSSGFGVKRDYLASFNKANHVDF